MINKLMTMSPEYGEEIDRLMDGWMDGWMIDR
jgi:hypothetical protein